MAIVDEVLDFTQLRKGQVQLEMAPFDLSALLDGVAALMAPRASAKGLRLDTEMTGFTTRRFVGDAGRIRQVLLNLVSNALKFTESGEVVVSAQVLPSESNPRVRLTVRDTGTGIPEATLSRVFARYHQNDPQTANRVGGSGLGLAISKELVELMGGEIGVDSRVGEGTEFWAEIDLEPGPDDTLRVEDPDGTGDLWIRDGARVLLAEDNLVNQKLAKLMLGKAGYQVEVANNGLEAVEKYTAAPDDVDLIFMDVQMPEMDGKEATAAIRKLGHHSVPIIAMTAHAMKGDRDMCLQAGMNDYLTKPIKRESVFAIIEKNLFNKEAA